MSVGKNTGRVMAIDLGEKRIGIALSDPQRMFVTPFLVMKRKSRREDFVRYNTLIAEQKVTLIVMGLPTYLDGTDSDQTRWVRDYSAEFAKTTPVPLIFQDEAHSSQQARDHLIQRGTPRHKRQKIDAEAAAIILKNYLKKPQQKEAKPQK